MYRIDRVIDLWMRHVRGAEIVIMNDFHPPPYGGGNQFLGALRSNLIRRGYSVGVNRCGRKTRAMLFNSFNCDADRIRRLRDKGIYMVHRVDGPISAYRGKDRDIDESIWELNNEVADATVFQSQYSVDKHKEIGLEFKNPTIIHNACDDRIFHQPTQRIAHGDERVRLIATSWSDNPKKGGADYKWLDDNLDFSRYEFTFLGRTPETFKNIKLLPPLPSEAVAEMLRAHDIYITASRNDCCSNALIEALSCGLPSVYHDSGGSRELVRSAGFGFSEVEEVPELLDRCVGELDRLRDAIRVDSIADVSQKYLNVMQLQRADV